MFVRLIWSFVLDTRAWSALLSSTTYFLHYIIWSSCQVINSRDFDFPFNSEKLTEVEKKKLSELGKKLQKDLQKNSEVAVRNYAARSRTYVMENSISI